MPNDIIVTKVILQNFKRFAFFEVDFTDPLSILIGDNEAGKSSILQAIDIVLSGSRSKVENLGLENLFNCQVIKDFLASERKNEELPKLRIEVYLKEQENHYSSGKYNSKDIKCDGLTLECKPNDDLSNEITEVLQQGNDNFPFEYYSINFKTFAGSTFSGYKKFLSHIVVDNSQVSSEYAMKEYVQEIYDATVQGVEKLTNQHMYREFKGDFKKTVLSTLNDRLTDSGLTFALKNTPKTNLENDLTIYEGDVNIENKGKGNQCFIKTELALRSRPELDIVLIEEPENHLSHTRVQNLIQNIRKAENKQIIIATHSDLISARLDLRKTILLNSNSTAPLTLNSLSGDTAKFFMKSTSNNILRFILSKKVLLVEGDAEYILMEAMYRRITGKELSESDVHIIAVGGTSFKRYLELAKILSIRTAVITDNDGHVDAVIKKYADYTNPIILNIKIFYDTDPIKKTFEICVYDDNQKICDELFAKAPRISSVQDYMLNNKADCAFSILENKASEITVPKYIRDAISWINE